MGKIYRFLLRRLREPSTWAGIVGAVTTMAGYNLSGDQQEAIVGLGVALTAVLLAFTRESGEVRARDQEQTRDAIRRAGDAVYGDPGVHDGTADPVSPDDRDPGGAANTDRPRRPLGRNTGRF